MKDFRMCWIISIILLIKTNKIIGWEAHQLMNKSNQVNLFNKKNSKGVNHIKAMI